MPSSRSSRSQRRPIALDDFMAIAVVDRPRLSPNGESVAYTLTTIDAEANAYRSAIWTVPYAGGEPRQLTSGTGRDRLATWSPDGRSIAFISDRGEQRGQIFVLPVSGGEARQVTRSLKGIEGVAWSPDSTQLVFAARVLPEDQPSMLDNPTPPVFREIRRIKQKGDGKGWLDGRTHLFVVDVASGAPRQITDGDWDDGAAAWSPDGKTIAFASSRGETRDWDEASELYAVSPNGGRVRKISRGGHSLSAPAWSPDGQTIACLGKAADAPAGPNIHLWTVPAAGGDPICLTESADISVGSDVLSDLRAGHATLPPIWTEDGSSLRFLMTQRGSCGLYELDVDGGSPRKLVGGERVVLDADGGGKRIVYGATSSLDPGDIFAARGDGSHEKRLTNVNAAFLESVELIAPEYSQVQAADGAQVDCWFLPGRGRGKRPMLLEIHGGPHASYGNAFFHELQLMAARGYSVLYTNPRGSRGYGEQFCSEIAGDWGNLDYFDLMAAVDAFVKRLDVDGRRLGVTGGSYGGYMTNWVVGHTQRFKAAITARCLSNLVSFYGTSDIGPWFAEREFSGMPHQNLEGYWRQSPLAYVDQVTTPMLILHSESDLRCPIEQAEQWFTSLRRLGKTVEFLRFPEESHDLSRSGRPDRRRVRLERIVGWLDRWLK